MNETEEMNQKEQQKNPTAIDFLNSEWAQEAINSKIKIAQLMEENSKLRDVVEKQKKVISSYKNKDEKSDV